MRISDWSSDVCSSDLRALLRADKLQKRAARTGVDWPDATGARAKIDEELAAVETAATDADRAEEIGDLLFAVVTWARKLGIEPEAALRAASAKFERRFRDMETRAGDARSEEHTSELPSLMRISYAVFCLKTKNT